MSVFDQRADVAIVGAGLAGLAAAAYLARAGRNVAVFDSDAPGGRAATRSVEGFCLNRGPHALYRGGAAVEVLRELEVPYTGQPSPSRGVWAFRGDGVYRLPRNAVDLATSDLLGPAAKLELGKFYAQLPGLKPEALNSVSVRDWLDQTVKRPEVRQLVEAMIRLSTFAHDPERLSAGATVRQLQRGSAGVLYLDGGWQSLVEGLRAAAETAGARIFPGSRVARVRLDGSVRGIVLADGSEWRAERVLLTARPAVAAALVPEVESPLPAWAEQAIPLRVACLTVGLRRLPNPDALFALGLEEPLYFSVHSESARLTPEGGALVHAARYLGSEPAADPAGVERELEALLDRFQSGWRDELRVREYLPNMLAGSALARADQGGEAGRPACVVERAPGLFLAGDWVGPEGMLADASLASARAAAREILTGKPAARDMVYAA